MTQETAEYQKQLKAIEKEEELLAQRKKEIQTRQERMALINQKLEGFFKETGFQDPRELVEALIEAYDVRLSGYTKVNPNRRRRTRITASLRDTIKGEVSAGASMNKTSKKFGISYVVISKIVKGAYDKLN